MDGFYEVTYEGAPIGKTELRRQGLYCWITCRCRIPDDEMYRLAAAWTDGWLNIGILIPDSDGLILKKSFPAKHLGMQNLRFELMKAAKDPAEVLFPKQPPKVQQDETTEPDIVVVPEAAAKENVSENKEKAVGIAEDEPFEGLHEIMNAKLEIGEEGPVAIFEREESDVQGEPYGTVVGSENVCIDGCGDDSIPDTV